MNCPHFCEFAAWFWSIGEKPENASLYLRASESIFMCDLKAEMARWDRMFERDFRQQLRREMRRQRRIYGHNRYNRYRAGECLGSDPDSPYWSPSVSDRDSVIDPADYDNS